MKGETMKNFLKLSIEEPKLLPPSHCWVLLEPNALRQHIHNLQESDSKLHLLLSWRDVNHRFWQWIRSVLIVHENNLPETLPNKWVSDPACEFIELVTRLCNSMSHFNVEYSHLLNDAKPGLCKNLIMNEGLNSTEDILSYIHKELLILTDLVMFANFPTDTGLMPYNFLYNIVNDEKEPFEKEDKFGLNFTLEDECAKLKLIVDKLKTECEGVKYNLAQELQKAVLKAGLLLNIQLVFTIYIFTLQKFQNKVSLGIKESCGFQYIDRDRLLLAVQIAKRDARCLSSSKIEDDGYIPETAQNFNISSLSSPVDNLLVQKPTQVVRSTDQKYKSILSKPRILPSRNDFYQTTRKLATNTHYQTFDDKAPACSDSPPIRDTDTWTPNRKRALHEPTEKQLRNSQESRIRQLQTKLSQYSDALEELRAKCLSNKAQSQELGSTCKVRKKSLLKIPANNSKSVISSIIRPKSSALRSHLVCKPNTRNSSKIIKSHSFNGVNLTHDNCPMSPTSISINARDHYDSKVSSLWEQAINSLNLDGSSAVTCQPGEYLKNQSPVKSLCGIADDQHIQNSSNQLTINTIKSNLDDCRVLCSAAQELLKQIDEAELEENAIRQRWANKLTYIHDDRKLLNNFPFAKKDDSVCNNHKSDVLSLLNDRSQLQQNDKSIIRPHTSTFQFPKNEAYSKVKSDCNLVDKKSSPLAHFHPLILPVKLHRQLLQSKSRQDVHAKNIWFYLLPTTTFNNLPDIPVIRVCEDLTNDLIQEAVDELYQTIDRAASELVDELIKAELLPEAPDITLSFDKCDDDPHGLSTPALFHQSDLLVHEFDAPVVYKNCSENQTTSNVTSILEIQQESSISNDESVNRLSNSEHTCSISEDISEKYTSEFEDDTVS
ncbi:unnamed protein product [Schistosoma spindalis]|nr:unnamed protein product [Schistosoma spindale]